MWINIREKENYKKIILKGEVIGSQMHYKK